MMDHFPEIEEDFDFGGPRLHGHGIRKRKSGQHRADNLDQRFYAESWGRNRCCNEFVLPNETLSVCWDLFGPREVDEDRRSCEILRRPGRGARVVHFDEQDLVQHWRTENAAKFREERNEEEEKKLSIRGEHE